MQRSIAVFVRNVNNYLLSLCQKLRNRYVADHARVVERSFTLVVLGIELSKHVEQDLDNLDASSQHCTVQRCLILIKPHIDVSSQAICLLRLIEDVSDLLGIFLANRFKQLLVRLLLQLPPIVPGDHGLLSAFSLHFNSMFLLFSSTSFHATVYWQRVERFEVSEVSFLLSHHVAVSLVFYQLRVLFCLFFLQRLDIVHVLKCINQLWIVFEVFLTNAK